MSERSFTINSTNSCKGMALLLLLWHHLFYLRPEFGFITYNTALIAKACVAIFVILSGYGYSESVRSKSVGLLTFYKKRLITLYSNYWFIAVIFVPIGIFFMHRPLQDAFTSDAYTKFMIQMTGFHRFVYSEDGYNATWWYMSIIISLVILFPFIYDLVRKYGILVLLGFLLILIPDYPLIAVINTWLLPFALGIYLSQRNLISVISKSIIPFGYWRFILLIAITVLLSVWRTYGPLLGGAEIDWLLGVVIILLVFESTLLFKPVDKILGFLGKHLFNIYLFHAFIIYYYWPRFIYSFNNPILLFLVTLCICIVVSLGIEQLKKVTLFNRLLRKAQELKVPSMIDAKFSLGN